MQDSALTQITRDKLRDTSNIIVLTYALAGLGHLRITDSLYEGLPYGAHPIALGAQDRTLTITHRIASIHPLGRIIFDAVQNGLGETIFTKLYRIYLKNNTDLLYKQLRTLLDQRYVDPKHVLIVSTHFSLAHQLGRIKKRLARERNVSISLVVLVSDDSPHQIWYVPGADLMIAPSNFTKHGLEKYARSEGLPQVPIIVGRYPLNPYLASNSTITRIGERAHQWSPDSKRSIEVAVPISGAAVGLDYSADLIRYLHQANERFKFHVISKEAPFTELFLNRMKKRAYVSVYSSDKDKPVVEAYEQLYKKVTISLEITKPSEQAFKALATPQQNGGSILLFTDPVGKQEQDNLNFLRRFNLIAQKEENSKLLELALSNREFNRETHPELFSRCRSFRGIRIPADAHKAAAFILWCLAQGVFLQMAKAKLPKAKTYEEKEILGTDGVARFWNMVAERFL